MAMSARLRSAGIPTTEVVGFARYRAGPGLCRVDVVSVYVADAVDLGMVVAGLAPGITCDEALPATQHLLRQLAAVGVEHPDLNVKNILLARRTDATLMALVIDVDVMRWRGASASAEVQRANAARLVRSLRKWHTQFGCTIPDTLLTGVQQASHASGAPV
jgi:hypothetical protein